MNFATSTPSNTPCESIFRTVALLSLLLLSSCTNIRTGYLDGGSVGLLYSDVVLPLDTNMNRTLYSSESAESSVLRIREPLSVVRASVEWSSYGIGDTQLKNQIKELCRADVRRQSALFGIWRRDTIKVYGCK